MASHTSDGSSQIFLVSGKIQERNDFVGVFDDVSPRHVVQRWIVHALAFRIVAYSYLTLVSSQRKLQKKFPEHRAESPTIFLIILT